ncbi:MAG: TorF family putative porin [Woeseiaceae bacterium]|nr:TorF family putative porin [Woeseiaceae bacterium]
MRRICLPIALFLFANPSSAETEFSAELTATTDYLFRGVSQSMSAAALQGGVYIDNTSGWYLSAWGSSIDFVDSASPDDGARFELDLVAGYRRAISDSVGLSLDVNAYLYPSTRPGVDLDYLEWLTSIDVNERHRFTVGFSNDVFNSGADGWYYFASTSFDLPRDLTLDVAAGLYDLDDAYDASYSHGEVGIAGAVSSVDWRLSYSMTSGDDTELFDASTVGSRTVLTLSRWF